MHALVTCFLEVMVLAIIPLFIGLAVIRVLVVMKRTIVASILLMTIDRSLVVLIVSVALMIVAIFVVTMLLVARFPAMCGGKMGCLLFFRLLFVLGNLF